jgi:preprotein translocase subunit SecG
MIILLTIVHVIVCVFLVIVVLLQSGKAADLAGAFGGMGSQTAFGPRGSATVLSKATTFAAGMFMVTSLVLAVASTRNAGGAQTLLEKHGGAAQSRPNKSAPAGVPTKGPVLPMPDVSGGTAGAPSKPAQPPSAPVKK